MTYTSDTDTNTKSYALTIVCIWHGFRARHQEKIRRRKLALALLELNDAQLRDIGFVRPWNDRLQ